MHFSFNMVYLVDYSISHTLNRIWTLKTKTCWNICACTWDWFEGLANLGSSIRPKFIYNDFIVSKLRDDIGPVYQVYLCLTLRVFIQMLNMFITWCVYVKKIIIKTNIYRKTNNKKKIMFQKYLSVSLSFSY